MDFGHRTLYPGPQLLHDCSVVPDDAATIPGIDVHRLHAAADIDHCPFPDAVSSSLSGRNELFALGLAQHTIQDNSPETIKVRQAFFGEIDFGFCEVGRWAREEALGQFVLGSHGCKSLFLQLLRKIYSA
jgi:hypothetical protein